MRVWISKSLSTLALTAISGLVFTACNEHSLPATWDEGRVFTYGQVKDKSGNSYNTVTQGNLEWMAEDLVDLGVNNSGVSCRGAVSSKECERGGAFYSHTVAMTSCPSGWRLPTDKDWRALLSLAGQAVNSKCMTQKDAAFEASDKAKRFPLDLALGTCMADAGKALKATSGWNGFEGSNEMHFDAKPEGYRDISKEYLQVDEYAYYWSQDTIVNPSFGENQKSASSWYITKSNEVVHEENFVDLELSVRCVKDIGGKN